MEIFYFDLVYYINLCFPGGSAVKNPPASTGDTGDVGSIPGSARSPGEGNGINESLLSQSVMPNSL